MSNCSAFEVLFGRRRKGDRRVAFFFSGLLVLSLGGCGTEPATKPGSQAAAPPWRGSVVVFAFEVMRSDHLGVFGSRAGLTPELDRFASEEAQFVGRGVAASSAPLVALASTFTGTGALQHRLLGHLDAHLRPSLPTLAELYWQRGYDTVFFEPAPTWIWRYGLLRGMARTEAYSEEQVLHELPLFDSYPRFYWIQLPEADVPYGDRRAELPGRDLPAPARAFLGSAELMPHADPAHPLPPALQSQMAELFRQQVAAGDARFGRLLAALKSSAAFDDTVVVVTALTGTELGEHGGVLYGQNLHRESIEVPLLIHLPAALAGRMQFAEKAGTPVAAERLFATLAECIGAPPPPLVSPSLFRQARRPAVSALSMGNGFNTYSAVFPAEGAGLATQLIRRGRFAAGELHFYAAQAAEAGAAVALPEEPRQLFDRLHQRFEHAAPWQSAEVELEVRRWEEGGGSAAATLDEAGVARLGQAFENALFHHLDAERTTEEEDLLIRAVEKPAEMPPLGPAAAAQNAESGAPGEGKQPSSR